jgi:hypothetical protein
MSGRLCLRLRLLRVSSLLFSVTCRKGPSALPLPQMTPVNHTVTSPLQDPRDRKTVSAVTSTPSIASTQSISVTLSHYRTPSLDVTLCMALRVISDIGYDFLVSCLRICPSYCWQPYLRSILFTLFGFFTVLCVFSSVGTEHLGVLCVAAL